MHLFRDCRAGMPIWRLALSSSHGPIFFNRDVRCAGAVRVVVESDCAEAVRLVSYKISSEHPLHGVLDQIAQGVAFHGCIRFCLIPRPCNSVAD